MNRLCLFAGLFLFISLTATAQERTAYVRDILYVVLSQNAGSGETVRGGLRSGMPLIVLEESGDYSRVRTREGEVGWLETQYLMDQPAARDLLEAAESRVEALTEERDSLTATLEEIRGLYDEAVLTAEALSIEQQDQKEELDRISRISGNAVQTSQQNTELRTQVASLTSDVEALTLENQSLEALEQRNYFMHGVIAVILGALLAVILPRLVPKKRSDWA